MRLKERLLHALLYETGAIVVATILIMITGEKGQSALLVSVIMALMAMSWNLIFNSVFDYLVKGKRTERSIGLRILHSILFEGCLVLATTPVIAYILQISLWQALLMDISLTLLLTVYTFFFNWLYDHSREKWFVLAN